MRILTFTNLYPNHIQPNRGIFIKRRMDAFCKLTGAYMDVVAPVPYFPRLPIKTRWQEFSRIKTEETFDGVKVYHPRYIVIPNRGMHTHGKTMLRVTLPLVRRLHEQQPYDLIDAHWVYPDGWAAVQIGKIFNIPVIVSARGDDINVYADMDKIRQLLVETFDDCTHIISVSKGIKRNIVELGVNEAKITVIPNGVCTKTFRLGDKRKARKKLRIQDNLFVALSVGRLEDEKAHDLLIEAWHELNKKMSNSSKLFIAGSGSLHPYLSKKIAELSLQKNVILLGHVSNHQLFDWYSAADIFCLASKREGSPNVILEAGASGLPVVVPDIDAFRESVYNNKTGILVPERSASHFANAITQAINFDWSYEFIQKYYQKRDWIKVAAEIEKLLKENLNVKGKEIMKIVKE